MIADMAREERPRERLIHYGASALANRELLAILLRTGVQGCSVLDLSDRLLSEFGGLRGLSQATVNEISQTVHGLGPAKAAQVLAALELGQRAATLHPDEKPQVKTPADAANLLMGDMAYFNQEHLRVLILDTKNVVQNQWRHSLYKGSLNSSVVRVAEVFREAIRCNAAAIIVAHNHPSGDPTPSPEDIRVTRDIRQAGELLDIQLLDHIVIGAQRWVSMKERGLGF
ncbi:MAG: DNA repair protein RadC [Ardenticatenales bacterium]|nr:DNA repair protein RadC [Ardenticatenales bacterium]